MAVIAGREVSHCCDGKAPALFRVRILPVVVPKTLKQPLYGVLVVADKVGILGNVVTIPEISERHYDGKD